MEPKVADEIQFSKSEHAGDGFPQLRKGVRTSPRAQHVAQPVLAPEPHHRFSPTLRRRTRTCHQQAKGMCAE